MAGWRQHWCFTRQHPFPHSQQEEKLVLWQPAQTPGFRRCPCVCAVTVTHTSEGPWVTCLPTRTNMHGSRRMNL